MEVNAEQTLAQLRRMVYADNVTDGPTLKDTILKKLAEPESGGSVARYSVPPLRVIELSITC